MVRYCRRHEATPLLFSRRMPNTFFACSRWGGVTGVQKQIPDVKNVPPSLQPYLHLLPVPFFTTRILNRHTVEMEVKNEGVRRLENPTPAEVAKDVVEAIITAIEVSHTAVASA